MTNEMLLQYASIKREIKDLENRIEDVESDIDNLKLKELSTKQNCEFESVLNELKDTLRESRLELCKTYLAIEQFIESVDDSIMRQIMRYRFIDCNTWQEVANRVKGNTSASLRTMYYRFMSNL